MWTGRGDNYAYLVVDDQSREAVIIDPAHPSEVAPVLRRQLDAGEIKLTGILNTHQYGCTVTPKEQLTRVRGAEGADGRALMIIVIGIMQAGTTRWYLDLFGPLPVTGGKDCQAVTKTPQHREQFSIGQNISVTALHTPCHTQDSICYLMQDGEDRVVFTGDTLFIGGCGRFFEGTAKDMFAALGGTLAHLPDDTRVFPGHEYTKANAKFALTVMDSKWTRRLQSFAEANEQTQGKFTIADEKWHNPFMRLGDEQLHKATGETDFVKVMAALREMKNNFKG
ncbi:MAG: Molybdopterin synthase catalytic subunit [Watsoniomyces obsoletus]|nr:MAG: Molybdopterin synthase catalytic subunit [Watsoniomyces obsoletus]